MRLFSLSPPRFFAPVNCEVQRPAFVPARLENGNCFPLASFGRDCFFFSPPFFVLDRGPPLQGCSVLDRTTWVLFELSPHHRFGVRSFLRAVVGVFGAFQAPRQSHPRLPPVPPTNTLIDPASRPPLLPSDPPAQTPVCAPPAAGPDSAVFSPFPC